MSLTSRKKKYFCDNFALHVTIKNMKRFIGLLTILTCCTSIFAAPAENQVTKSTFTRVDEYSTRVIVGKRGKHHFTIRLSEGRLRKDRHIFRNKKGKIIPAQNINLDGKEPETGGQISIDGNLSSIGTDYGLPYIEFYAFDVMVDGKKWIIPEKLWADCYQPNIYISHNPAFNYLWVVLSPDGTRLAIGMWGGDAAGSYHVIWYLRADGKNSRKITRGD
jgi:hypothetical protein